ncbi:isochorismatase [Haematobacter missouriensis]|mgnify:CR=1 FL=1|uniref:Isochorismatase n=1 Tax=Haematobacter missouriensis TaxID=366616 RepID=A0A212ASX0_9RHOB|nr:isochorismatase family protein [Haematobacter missouriensis]KFI31561.1 isochorismatase [Haematobacter missouriensis]OWJ75423.1 isochorismatase [Haematobacter missouriensis]OWJ84535.1 isochorismatase [Haematobacter missouriensis]
MKALIIIDMQMEMQHRIDSGADHVNPDAPLRIVALSDAFRQKGWPVVHVRHRDADPTSPFHQGAPGHAPMPCDDAQKSEPVFLKTTSSGFASTDLAPYLQGKGISDLVVTGAVAGFCVNSTVRAGADLGFNMTVARDAVIGFGLPAAGLSARMIFDVTMAHLKADFARVVDAAVLLDE